MNRLLLSLLGLLTVALACPAQAPERAKPTDAAKAPADLSVDQEILARQYRDFEKALLKLAQRMEASTKPEEREKAANLKKAITLSGERDIKGRFDKLILTLKSTKGLSLQELDSAMKDSKMVADDIRLIIQLLQADTRDDELKREKKRLMDLIKALEEVIRKQKVVRAQTEAGKMEKNPLVDSQKKVTKNTADIARAMGKDGKAGDASEAKKSDAKGEGKGKGDGKGKGEGKGQGEGKGKGEGEGKGDGKGKGEGSGSAQQGSSAKKGDGKPQPPSPGGDDNKQQTPGLPGRQQIQDANKYQKQAEDELEKEDRAEASKDQDKALKELEEARKKLEEILRQLREEELERLLAALEARCRHMLAMQIEVRDGTVRVFKAIEENADKKPTRANEQRALQLSDREQQIVDEATAAIKLLEAEGSAVAFPEVFIQLREDMRHVTRRLGKADVGTVTQVIEDDIIQTLKEMIEALKKAQQQMQANRSNPNPNPNQNQKLLDLLAELKMIRSMQVRVNSRTKVYGEKYQGEQAADEGIQKELADLAVRQQKIFDVTDNIYRGKNK